MTAVRKFTPDTVFTPEGEVTYTPKRERLTYKRDEVEEIKKDVFAEGERSAVAEAERRTAAAMEQLAAHVGALTKSLAATRAELRRDAVELALASARAAAEAAMRQYPEEILAGLFDECLDALRDSPTIAAEVAPDAVEAVSARLSAMAESAGLKGAVTVSPGAGQVRVIWSDGAAGVDPEAALASAREAAERWLAASERRDDGQLNLFDAPHDGKEP